MMHEFHCPLILIYYKSSLINSFSRSASFVVNFLICIFFLHFLSLPLNFADEVFYFSHFLWETHSDQHFYISSPSLFLPLALLSNLQTAVRFVFIILALSHSSYKVSSISLSLRRFLKTPHLFILMVTFVS